MAKIVKTISMPINVNQNYSGNSAWIRSNGCAVCCGVDLAAWKNKTVYEISDFSGRYDEVNGYNWTGPDGFSCGSAVWLTDKNEAETIEVIRSYINRGIPIACHATGYNKKQHWFVAHELTEENGSTWATAGINVLDPYNGNKDSYNGRRVSIWDAMQTSKVPLGIDRIRVPN